MQRGKLLIASIVVIILVLFILLMLGLWLPSGPFYGGEVEKKTIYTIMGTAFSLFSLYLCFICYVDEYSADSLKKA